VFVGVKKLKEKICSHKWKWIWCEGTLYSSN